MLRLTNYMQRHQGRVTPKFRCPPMRPFHFDGLPTLHQNAASFGYNNPVSLGNSEFAGEKTIYTAHLQEDDLNALRRLLGLGIYGIYEVFSSSLEANRMLLTAPSFSFRLDHDSWAVVRSEWLETPAEFIDYFRLSVRLESRPDGIEVSVNGALINPSHILLVPGSRVVRIEVLSIKDGTGIERVQYDHGIRFFREDGRDFCVTAQRSVAGQTHFTEEPATMVKLLEGCSVRLKIE